MIPGAFDYHRPSSVKEAVGLLAQLGEDARAVAGGETTGWMDLELTGDSTEIDRAIAGLRKKGIVVDPIELNVVE